VTTEEDWEVRIIHLQEMHRFGECNHAKEFGRKDNFRRHLKHSHAATSGKWMDMLINTCRQVESLPELPSPWVLRRSPSPEKILGSDGIELEAPNTSQGTVDGYKNFGSERFERNLRRILKKFALSLRREARNELEKSAIHLVHNYRAYIIILIRKRLELAEDGRATSLDELRKQKQSKLALERFLGLIPSAQEDGEEDRIEENECGSDIDSDLSDSEQPILRNLEKVKLYLLSSTAFSELKQQLTEFVRPSNKTTVLGVDESLPVGLDTEHDEAEMRVENFVTEGYSIPASKPEEEDYPQFGSSSIRASEFAWNSVSHVPLNGRPWRKQTR
jgi:hypothetical protein